MSHSNDARYISIRDAASANDHDNYTYREMTKYTANLSQQFGGGSLSFYGIWVKTGSMVPITPIS